MDRSGEVTAVRDHGTMWMLHYRGPDGGGMVGFDWRQFAHVYEAESGHSFYADYAFGRNRAAVETYFQGRTIHVEGEPFEERVWFE